MKTVVDASRPDPAGDVAEPRMVVVGTSPIGANVGDDGPPLVLEHAVIDNAMTHEHATMWTSASWTLDPVSRCVPTPGS